MNRVFFSLLLCYGSLFAIDSDFDGVEDESDSCLETNMLETVSADGCSESQKNRVEITLLQSYSMVDIDDKNTLNSYNLALMFTKESWLFYIGSGYFKYNNPSQTVKNVSDTTILLQKSLVLNQHHAYTSSFSMVLPSNNEEGNRVDYEANLAYGYRYKKFNVELSYQYDWMNDSNSENISSIHTYVNYTPTDVWSLLLGYTQDSLKRKDRMLQVHYLYSSSVNFSYSYSKGQDNFYDTIHTFGVGYRF